MDLGLDILRTVGRAPKEVDFEVDRAITAADLPALQADRGAKVSPLRRLGERHHHLARLLASGTEPVAASAITGYDLTYISILRGDPTFKKLLDHYVRAGAERFSDFHGKLAGLGEEAVNELYARLETDPNEFTNAQLMELTRVAADRTGHGPTTTNVQVNVGLAARLEAARKRIVDITPDRDMLPGASDQAA